MKKAFTLIELLVVIAIIAILAAILFPVFAQAKTAAKKATSVSNQKQIGLAQIMYANDYDDTYAREDGCTLNDSLNQTFDVQPAGTDPSPWCNGSSGYAFRDNHYSWTKWFRPYAKSDALFFHPTIQKDSYGWNTNGELLGGYMLNLGITGSLNTWGVSATANGQLRTSWLGGTTTAVPSPAEAWLIMEFAHPSNAFVGTVSGPAAVAQTVYPKANRENFIPIFYKRIGTTGCNYDQTTLDPNKTPWGNTTVLSYCDGHTKSVAVGDFLAKSPSQTDYVSTYSAANCGIGSGNWTNAAGAPTWTQPWPLWGLN